MKDEARCRLAFQVAFMLGSRSVPPGGLAASSGGAAERDRVGQVKRQRIRADRDAACCVPSRYVFRCTAEHAEERRGWAF
jgi:hypothetical protein